LGALANKYILEHDEKCLDALREARARFAMPRFRHIKKWLDETIKELESDPKRNGNPRAKRRK